ncbi:hypothetical protein SAMD00019534_093900 [Acytostelium subglobosum LB1]|uniref:hypothetical protein n=1 Tax=Acytostelium subglobosum LB1 TaxID=1410327 RepID=UPI0006450E97|nr:hypothetical protein SAMD00019534_093900 [Acytostelium subglobosum LB1]GAM26215.1 hypothetical protein SAMD00019534_093900 [Acytostelium subglobosum LB1]|eukprot:XP_012750769.1 hypothetical protein SAMD00019534_093900 [Acytostelium subglobosum LB1]
MAAIQKALDQHRMVHYHFGGDNDDDAPFKQAIIEPQYFIPFLKSVRIHATKDGSLCIITMCERLLAKIK